MSEEYEEQMKQLYEAYEQEKNQRQQYERSNASRYSGSNQNDDLIRWQLEVDNILERVEHLLRGDELKFDDEGNLSWRPATNANDVLLNEYGVQEVLRLLSMYLNRNTILSNYDEPTINDKVFDFGMELIDLVFMKYEQMGLNDEQKIKNYPMLNRVIVDVVHSAYLRALNGGERESLRESRHVSQNINPMMPNLPNNNRNGGKPFSVWKPTTWFKN